MSKGNEIEEMKDRYNQLGKVVDLNDLSDREILMLLTQESADAMALRKNGVDEIQVEHQGSVVVELGGDKTKETEPVVIALKDSIEVDDDGYQVIRVG